jgi:hypothetical protein
MKYLLALFLSATAVAFVAPAHASDEGNQTKKVCLDVQGKDGKPVIDPKTKAPKQDCKTVKVHKKFEGHAVPEGKKK